MRRPRLLGLVLDPRPVSRKELRRLSQRQNASDAIAILAGYYLRSAAGGPSAERKAVQYVLRLIGDPQSEEIAGVLGELLRASLETRSGVAIATKGISSAVNGRGAPSRLIHAAATFFMEDNPLKSISLLRRGLRDSQSLDPWIDELTKLGERIVFSKAVMSYLRFDNNLIMLDGAERRIARCLVLVLSSQLKKCVGTSRAVELMSRIAVIRCYSGEYRRAGDCARSILRESKQRRPAGDSAQLNHLALTILGLEALKQGRSAAARNYLLRSSRVGYSRLLDRTGPCMTLAGPLLRRNDSSTVLDYLRGCRRLWPSGGQSLQCWRREIVEGKRTQFGHHEVLI
jgi:hypothetical protein